MTATKPLADIACIVRVGDDTPEAALRQAILLASRHGAHLTATIAAHQLASPYSPFWMSLTSSLVADMNKKTKARADEVADKARTAARIGGVNADVDVVFDMVGQTAEYAVRAARAADVIVVDQPDAVMDTKATVLEEALFRSGRPVLVATPRREPIETVRKLMIAWDGTAHAARAAADALAIFADIDDVEIVSVSGEKSLDRSLPGSDYARHLSRKGKKATLVELTIGDLGVAAVLDRHASASGADLIAMGGYGHSRLREFVLGGVTRELIQSSATPLLMAY
jgi:nucleotide-binding universal stress UspA family protein